MFVEFVLFRHIIEQSFTISKLFNILYLRQPVIMASMKYEQPQILKATLLSAKTSSEHTHSREELLLSSSQESLQTSTKRLQRKRKATEVVFSSSFQKGVRCADPKLLNQVMYNKHPSAHSDLSTLKRNCQYVGLQIDGEIPGNGNCFFEAVSRQLKRLNSPVQRSPHQLRQDAVAFLKANRVLQVSTGNINFAEFLYNESFEQYCERMEKDGEWADHVIVVAMARALQTDIMIVTSSPSAGSDDNIAWVVGQENFQEDPILLGHIWEQHYESLKPIDSFLDSEQQRKSVENMEIDERNRQEYQRECGQKYLMDIHAFLKDKPAMVHLVDEDFALDNSIVDSRLEDLKRKIVDVASQQPYWGKQIPTRWFLLEQQLMSLRDAGMKVISRNGVEELNKKETVQIKKSEELDLFLTYLHEIGTIIYFSIEILRDNIILVPQWLIDSLKMLINSHLSLPESLAVNGPQSIIPNDNGSQPQIPNDRNVGNNQHSNISTDSDIRKKWSNFKTKGILTIELVDAIWTQDKHPDLHKHRDHLLGIMEQLNIIARPRSFSEIGEKIENYFLVPSMLRDKSPRDIIFPEKDPLVVSTPFLCCVFTEKFLPAPIFHRLVAACTSQWPVAKNMETSENLIFIGSCVFNLDLYHRLILHYKNYIVFARITRFVVSTVESPDAKLCTRVRKFITLNLSKITSCFGQNLKYELHSSRSPNEDGISAPFQMWCACEEHDSDAPIRPEHMYHARINVALVTVCANALREILLTCVPIPYSNIYQALLANIAILTSRTRNELGQWQKALLNRNQCQVVFPDPNDLYVGTVDQFDVSLLYVLIRNISVLSHAYQHWGTNPAENPNRDISLGANVERIHSLRNEISHSIDGELSNDDFAAFWIRMDAVLDDIDQALGRQEYRAQLERQRIQVISVYEAY